MSMCKYHRPVQLHPNSPVELDKWKNAMRRSGLWKVIFFFADYVTTHHAYSSVYFVSIYRVHITSVTIYIHIHKSISLPLYMLWISSAFLLASFLKASVSRSNTVRAPGISAVNLWACEFRNGNQYEICCLAGWLSFIVAGVVDVMV